MEQEIYQTEYSLAKMISEGARIFKDIWQLILIIVLAVVLFFLLKKKKPEGETPTSGTIEEETAPKEEAGTPIETEAPRVEEKPVESAVEEKPAEPIVEEKPVETEEEKPEV